MKLKSTFSLSRFLIGAIFSCASLGLFAQTEPCLSDILHKRHMAEDTAYAREMIKNEALIQEAINAYQSGSRMMATSYRIPVVVHVIHLGEAVGTGTNISDAQIYSAIRSLNDAYRKKTGTIWFGNGVDTGIEFCLAQKDASGNPSTGILRVNGSSTSDYATNGITTTGTNNETTIKALSKWANTKYYNIWVVSEIDGNNGGSGTQGYAYFPGASATYDGAVMLYNAFGFDPTGSLGYNLKSYTNYNATCIHEMGHALNLYHTFQGDGTGSTCPTDVTCGTSGDCVSDTPKHMRSASSCVADGTANSCQAGTTAADFQHNYMDYSADACKNMFTAGQSTRMNAALATGGRSSLTTATNLTNCGCDIPVVLFTASPVNPCLGIPVQFTDQSLNFPTSWSWTFTGGSPASATVQNPTSTYNSAGSYDVSLQATTAAGTSLTLTKTAYITPISSATLPFSENFEGVTFPPAGWSAVSADAPSVAWGTDGIHQWLRRPAAGNTGSTAGSAAMNNFNYNLVGPPIDNLIVKPVSLSGMSTATMTFRLSYKYYPSATNYDSLKVFVSTDCGNTFGNAVYSKSGTTLATNGSLSSSFTPGAVADWRTETVNLNSYIGQTIIVKFVNYSNYGNNVYLDDVNITGTSASPVAGVTIASNDADNTICTGTSVTYTATPTNGGTTPSYQWKVNGANVGTNSSTYTTTTLTTGQSVSCVMTSNLAGVTGNPATSNAIVMTVNAIPTAPTATSNSPVCAGSTINLTASTVTGASYNWTGPGAYSNATQNPSRAGATAAMAGTYSVTATVSGCISAAGTVAVVVNAIPTTPTATSNSPVCVGSAINLTASTVTGATYSWTGPGYTNSTQNPSIASSTVAMSGTYSVTATVGGCISAAGTVAVVVNAIPTAPTATSNSPVCVGSTINLTASTVTGATYSWTGPGAYSNATQNPSRAGATAGMAGTYSVTATISGCTSAAGTVAVVVNAIPTAPTATSNSPVCAGSTINLTSSTVTGATYSWTGPGAYSNATQNPSRSGATAGMAGTYSVTATISGCTSAAGTVAVVVNAIPTAPTATSNSPVCAGSTINLTASTVTGATYSWTGPGAYSNATQNPSRAGATAGMAGTYSVTATVSGCTSAAGTIAVVVNAIPATPTATSNSPVCVGATINLTASTVTGATYSWTGPAFTSSTQNPSIVSSTVAMSGTYSVTATVGGCTSAAGTVAVVVNSIPAAPTATSNSPVCAGSTINLTASIVTGATYTWTGPAYTNSTQNPSRAGATAGMAGTYSVTATVSGCTSAAGTVAVVVNAIPTAPTATSNSPVCAGSTINLTSSTVTGATYSWTGPGAYSNATQNPSRAGATAGMAGTYSVTATVSGCTSAAGTIAVVVNAIPTAPTATSNSPVCVGATINLTSSTVTGATYNWTGPGAYSNATQNPSRAGATAAMAGTYSVTATVSGCTSVAGTVAVVVNAIPTAPTATSNSPVCSGSTINLTSSTITGATYNWTGPGAYTSTSQNPSRPSATNGMSGTYNVTSTVNGCTSTAGIVTVSVSSTVAPSNTIAISSGNNPSCAGSAVTFSATPTNGGSTPVYQWKVNGLNAGTNSSVFSSSALTNGQNVTCILTSNSACASPTTATSNSISMVVNPIPAAPMAGSNSPVCSGSAINLTSSATGTTYNWTGPNAYSSTTQNPSQPGATMAMAGTYSVTATTNGCTSAIATISVIVNATPVLNITDPSAVCSPSTVDITAAMITTGSTGSGTLTYWTNAGATAALTSPNAVATSGTYYIKSTTAAGCVDIKPVTVTINPKPVLTITDPAAVCSPGTVDLTAASVTTGSTGSGTLTYWIDAGATTTLTSPASVATSGIYYIKSTTAAGCTDIKPVNVTINVQPTSTFTQSANQCLSGNSFSFTNTGGTGTYSWTFAGGTPSTSATNNPTSVTFATAGTYAISHVVTSVAGCTSATTTSSVIIYSAPTAQASTTVNETCGSANGSITLGATTGGVSPYSYSLDGSAFATSTNYAGLTSGSHTIIVKDFNGCQFTTTVNISNTNGPTALATTTSNSTCGGADGTITINSTTGGTGPYTYSLDGGSYTASTSLTGLSAGSHSVNVKDANGCSFTTTVTVGNSGTTPPTPTVTQNGSTLTSSSATGNQWYLDGVAIAGATGQDYIFTANGDYTVIVTTGACASGASATTTIINVGIEYLTVDPNVLLVYPNPSDGNFMLSFISQEKTNYKIEIFNALGQKVYSEDVKDFSGTYSKQLSVVEYGMGVYSVSLTNSKNQTVKKIVVY